MEFTNANATATTSGFLPEGQADSFNWQNPVFRMPSPRGQASSSTRVPGTVMSHRPRWTPEKHARILAQIKATRTDIDPSFPRATPVPADAAQTGARSLVKGAVQSVTQTTMSYIDSFTEYAFNLLYDGPTPATPAADHSTPPTGAGHPAHPPEGAGGDDPTSTWKMDPASRKRFFIATLVNTGWSTVAATDVALAWTASGVPLLKQTLPIRWAERFDFLPSDRSAGNSLALLVRLPSSTGEQQVLKCYPPSASVDLQEHNHVAGFDLREPKLEVRCLLASHIAHELLHWDIVPKTSLGFFNAQVCLVTQFIEGRTLQERLTNNVALNAKWSEAVQQRIVRLDTWENHTTERFRNDFTRILLFSMLIGDYDRKPEQFIVKGKRLDVVKAIDWDWSFGSKILDDKIFRTARMGVRDSLWPDAIPKTICDEFAKVTKNQLVEAAQAFGLAGDEVKALVSRFEVVTKKLATLPKT